MPRTTLNPLARGIVAGAIGTLAMTISETLEMSVTGRVASRVPGQVGTHMVPGRDPDSPAHVQALNNPVHWAHGIAMGAVRSALGLAGLQGSNATAVHFALMWGGDAALYRALGVADSPWRWDTNELATDLLHKGVYAAVTGTVYDALSDHA
jgi:hypothetical protein